MMMNAMPPGNPGFAPMVQGPMPSLPPQGYAMMPRQHENAPLVRAKGADQPASPVLLPEDHPKAVPLTLDMPSPEQLHVARPRPAQESPPLTFDWNRVDRRLNELGATSWVCQHMAQGGYRFVVLLPAARTDRVHHVEAEAPTANEAVERAMERAEEVAALKQ